MAEEASKLRGLEARVAALETKFNFLLQFIRRLTEREEEKKKAMISKRQEEICPALSLSKAAQTLPTPRRPAFHVPRPSRTEPRQFQPLPIPVPQLYTLLVKKKMITPVGPRTRIGPQPKDYNKDLTCDYHQGEVGHTVGNCRVLRHRIQDLLDQGVLKFRIEGIINAIGIERSDEVDIASAKIPWEPLCHEPNKQGLFTTSRSTERTSRTEASALMKEQTSKQEWIELKRISRSSVRKRKKNWGSSHQPHHRRCPSLDPVVIQYATKEKIMLQTASVSTIQSSEKVPSVVIQVPQPFPYQDDKRVPWNYGMKVISTREGKPKTEEEVVGNLTSGLGGITRSGRCYTPGGVREKKERNGKGGGGPRKNEGSRRRGRGFLKDNQEHSKRMPTVNPWRKLDIDPTRVRVTSMVVRAFDGTRREVLGEIDLPVEVGPQVYNINFQVLRIDSPYNLLLGRPWLHTAGAVPSSLHQKMKLIIGNQLVTILAEEPISIYNDGAVPYIDGCASEEASFHSFEFVTVIHRVAAVEPKLSKVGIMVAREFVKAGFQPGQGLGCANQGRTAIPEGKELQQSSEGKSGLKRKWLSPTSAPPSPASAMFQVDEGDVDELALLFTEDLSIDVITTEGDSTAPPIRPDHCKGVDLEDFLDEEDLKGYRIEEETLDEDTGKDTDFPNLLPHLMIPRGLETLEFEMFCEHGDPEFHLRRYHEKMALYTDDELLMISMFHESLPECAVTWFYQLKNIACWEDLARAFLDRYRHNLKSLPPPPSNINTATTAEEEHAGPMVEGLSINAITYRGELHHTSDLPLPSKGPRCRPVCHCYSIPKVARRNKVNQVNSPKKEGKRSPKTEEKVNPRKAELSKYESSSEMFKLRTRVVLNGVKFKRRVILDFRKTPQVISKPKLSSHKPRRTKALHYGPLKVLPNWERLLSLRSLCQGNIMK
uniref:G-patch domain-containing protein n=1 Tax=Fagus sylvatica TaxID=28930 RepID=A0A2N9IZD2_FAGSY